MQINHLEKIEINNSTQWVLIRGRVNAPLIIQVQAGPGFPMISEAGAMQKKLQWEDEYLVAYWDQRGCGKSYYSSLDPRSVNLAQLTDDVLAMTRYLLKKYQKEKAILAGYSIGATLGLLAAAKNSNLFSHLFLVGLDIDIPTANRHIIDFALEKAGERKNKNALKEAVALKKIPITNAKSLQRRAKLLANLGGINTTSNYNQLFFSTVRNMLLSKEYKLSDIPKTIRGMNFCQDALLPEFDMLNLFSYKITIDVPVHFIQGVKDAIAPYAVTKKYFEFLSAKNKTLHRFENSAHMPHLEEPKKFFDIIRATA